MRAPTDPTTIRTVRDEDAPAIAALYNHYVEKTIVTFEETPVDAEEIGRRIAAVRAVPLPWLVATDGTALLGYAYATPWKARFGYRFSVEVSVYLDPAATGRGLGSALYRPLFDDLQARGLRSAIGGIALPNDASVALHQKFGMSKVAHFVDVGTKFGRWIDVGYWQCNWADAHPPPAP